MNKAQRILTISFLFYSFFCFAQDRNASDNLIINMVKKIDANSKSISFTNSIEINNSGGHLQGVQYYKYNQNDYYILSGSSDSYSYFSVVKTGDENSVISVNKILAKPFKHAGGFQIFKNLMAIGVEDNSDKNRSKVFIYRLESPENPPKVPLTIIEREGEQKRATAGCVGIIEFDDDLLVVVGDWDTKHLDIYRTKNKNLIRNGEPFKIINSIDAETIDKSNWINDSWLAYQNINLIKDFSNNLYLAGMALNSSKENILDIFKIGTENYTKFSLRKIYSKKFPYSEYVKFQWGGGIHLTEENQLNVFLCGAHIEKISKIIVYE